MKGVTESFFKFLDKWGINPTWVLIPAGILAAFFILIGYMENQVLFGVAFSWMFFFAPLWLPVLLIAGVWPLWVHYVQTKFILSQEMVLLEVLIPRDIMKSPRAMEAVFDGIAFGGGEATFINRNFEGKVRPWWSFELVSIGGQVHFYIWGRKGLKDVIDAHIYAQYPSVEIYEVEDYATAFSLDQKNTSVWGCDFKLTKDDVYPIKTYIDYELDKDPKEEFKIDPIASIFEALSAINPGEQMWLQIILRQNKDKRAKVVDKKSGKTALFATENRWKKEAEEEIAKIREDSTPTYKDKEGNEQSGFPNPTPGQVDAIKAIERSVGKNPFDVGIRGIYITSKDEFKVNRINMLTGLFRQFGSSNLNGLAPTGWFIKFSWPWQDWFISKDKMVDDLIDAYKRRSWFFHPYKTDHFVLTSEELATIYHFPSRTVQAPGLARIPATKFDAPSNLPL